MRLTRFTNQLTALLAGWDMALLLGGPLWLTAVSAFLTSFLVFKMVVRFNPPRAE